MFRFLRFIKHRHIGLIGVTPLSLDSNEGNTSTAAQVPRLTLRQDSADFTEGNTSVPIVAGFPSLTLSQNSAGSIDQGNSSTPKVARVPSLRLRLVSEDTWKVVPQSTQENSRGTVQSDGKFDIGLWAKQKKKERDLAHLDIKIGCKRKILDNVETKITTKIRAVDFHEGRIQALKDDQTKLEVEVKKTELFKCSFFSILPNVDFCVGQLSELVKSALPYS